VRAAFVTLTVAGQQGNSPPLLAAAAILDFRLPIWVGIESKIQNLKSKIGGGVGREKSPLSLDPSAPDYRVFITSSIRASICLRHQNTWWFARDNAKGTSARQPSRRLFGLSGKD
jgi:hypothetical protein